MALPLGKGGKLLDASWGQLSRSSSTPHERFPARSQPPARSLMDDLLLQCMPTGFLPIAEDSHLRWDSRCSRAAPLPGVFREHGTGGCYARQIGFGTVSDPLQVYYTRTPQHCWRDQPPEWDTGMVTKRPPSKRDRNCSGSACSTRSASSLAPGTATFTSLDFAVVMSAPSDAADR